MPPLIAALAMAPRLRTAVADIRTADEDLWMGRSLEFSDAITSGDLTKASATTYLLPGVEGSGTMPGVTTMWIGTLARGLWGAGRAVGLWATRDGDHHFATAESGWVAAQATMAVVTSALVGVLVLLVARWAGWRPAAIAGVLVATEPFVVAHGAVLHTDELLALLGASALVATALVLGKPAQTSWTDQRWAALVAGGLWGAALLTKVSALMFLPGVGLLGVWAVWSRRQAVPAIGRVAGWWLASALGVVLVSYPALWVAPVAELQAATDSLRLASEDQWQFFLGSATDKPGPAFYFVALPLRVTPWFLVAGVVAAVAICWRRSTRSLALAAGCMIGPPLVVQSLATKQFARYGLVMLVLLAVVVGIAADALFDELRRRDPSRRLEAGVGGVAGALAAIHAIAIAPWGLGYFNPVLGGAATAERAIIVGWGEGIDGTGDIVERDRRGDCDGVTYFAFIASGDIACGEPASDDEVPTYVAIYVAERQRMTEAARSKVVGERELVGEVRRRGITYVEVFGPPEDEAAALTSDEMFRLLGF